MKARQAKLSTVGNASTSALREGTSSMRSGETTGAPPWAGRSGNGTATSMNAIRSRQARKSAPADETPIPCLPLLRIAFSSGILRKSTFAGKGSVTTLGSKHAAGDAASPRLLGLGTNRVKHSGRTASGEAASRTRLGRGVSALTRGRNPGEELPELLLGGPKRSLFLKFCKVFVWAC